MLDVGYELVFHIIIIKEGKIKDPVDFCHRSSDLVGSRETTSPSSFIDYDTGPAKRR
jgi:hypothetical protein